ncbi:polyketide synthase dehydratase domain-containing protein [Streptomyces lasalocidi]
MGAAPEAWPPPGAVPVPVDYPRLASHGLRYGPAFRAVTALWRRDEEVFAELALPPGDAATSRRVHAAPRPPRRGAALRAAGRGAGRSRRAGRGCRWPAPACRCTCPAPTPLVPCYGGWARTSSGSPSPTRSVGPSPPWSPWSPARCRRCPGPPPGPTDSPGGPRPRSTTPLPHTRCSTSPAAAAALPCRPARPGPGARPAHRRTGTAARLDLRCPAGPSAGAHARRDR